MHYRAVLIEKVLDWLPLRMVKNNSTKRNKTILQFLLKIGKRSETKIELTNKIQEWVAKEENVVVYALSYVEKHNCILFAERQIVYHYSVWTEQVVPYLSPKERDCIRGLTFLEHNLDYVVTGGDNAIIRIWDFNNKSMLNEIKIGYIWSVYSLAKFNSTFIAIGTNAPTKLIIFDVEKCLPVIEFCSEHTQPLRRMLHHHEYHPNYLITGGGDSKINLWDLERMCKLITYKSSHTGWIEELLHYKDDIFISLDDNFICFWKTLEENCLRKINPGRRYFNLTLYTNKFRADSYFIYSYDSCIYKMEQEDNTIGIKLYEEPDIKLNFARYCSFKHQGETILFIPYSTIFIFKIYED
jgi:WD40 repeat protein